MNVTYRMRGYIAATLLVLISLASGLNHAQTVNVNGAACPTATVSFGTNVINILTGACTVPLPPTISNVTPNPGVPGTVVTIVGTNLTGATVTIGGVAAVVNSPGTAQITATIPAAAAVGVGNLVVNTSAGSAPYSFTVSPPPVPTISSASPLSGPVGTVVTLTGTSLAGATVTIGGAAASVTSTTTQITATVPAAATVALGSIVVTTGGGSTSTPFTVTPPAMPAITSVTPNSGSVGTVVTIAGTGLGGASVTIGGIAATVTSNTSTQIITTVPATAVVGPGTFTVTTGGGNTSIPFTVTLVPPVITLVSPNSAPVGAVVTISGSGFSGATVTIGGVAATLGTSSPTSITTTVPANATVGPGFVVVTTAVAPAASQGFTVAAAGSCSDVTIDGIAIPCPSKFPLLIPTHTGLSGGGTEMNAYAMPPTRCNTQTTNPISRSWQHNIDLAEYKKGGPVDYFSLQTNEALSFKFTAPTADAAGGFDYNEATNAASRPTYMTITSTPCDFDITKAVQGINRTACYMPGLSGNGVQWASIVGTLPASYCRLVKGQTYYLNIRFTDPRPVSEGGQPTLDSCNVGVCGGILKVN